MNQSCVKRTKCVIFDVVNFERGFDACPRCIINLTYEVMTSFLGMRDVFDLFKDDAHSDFVFGDDLPMPDHMLCGMVASPVRVMNHGASVDLSAYEFDCIFDIQGQQPHVPEWEEKVPEVTYTPCPNVPDVKCMTGPNVPDLACSLYAKAIGGGRSHKRRGPMTEKGKTSRIAFPKEMTKEIGAWLVNNRTIPYPDVQTKEEWCSRFDVPMKVLNTFLTNRRRRTLGTAMERLQNHVIPAMMAHGACMYRK